MSGEDDKEEAEAISGAAVLSSLVVQALGDFKRVWFSFEFLYRKQLRQDSSVFFMMLS